jgi:hypothetical protein
MTKKIRDPKVKDFIEESIDDCFELLETGECVNTKKKCSVFVCTLLYMVCNKL